MNALKRKIPAGLLIIIAVLLIFTVPSPFGKVSADATSAKAMCVMEKTSGRVLSSHNMRARLPMASTTKVVTAISVIENINDLNMVVKIPDAAVGIEGSSIYLCKDEELKIIDLLYGLMLQSGNDCAVALAIITSGSVKEFAALMNATALKIGADSSNFTNPHGLPDDNHYTTAYDLALISAYAMKNETFKTIVGTRTYRMPWKDREYGRIINNKNKILRDYEGGTGIKTGFTKKAGRCLVASSERAGMEVVTVVLNCGDMFNECMTLMDAAHSDYKMVKVAERGKVLGEVKVEKSRKLKADYGFADDYNYPLKENEIKKIKYSVNSAPKLSAPVRIGDNAGDCEIYLDKQLLFNVKIYTMEEAKSLTVKDRLIDLVHEWNS